MALEELNEALRAARILIVDDQEANTALLEGFLAQEGYAQVVATTDPRQALPLFRKRSPDLVLLDLHMPYLDGFAVLEQLRAEIPRAAYLPVLVLTADAAPEVRHRALFAGARDFLSKPLDFDEVSARIRNLLETRLLHRQLHERNLVLEMAMREIQLERKLSERLLLNVLPRPVAERLKREGGVIADSFPEATVLFADIENFTPMAAELPPEQLVSWLSGVFSAMDRLTEEHGLEKIKTIGDAYMAVSGVPTARPDHAEAAADLALAFREEASRMSCPNGESLRIRIGMHSGPVVAGVLGSSKFAYDLWGDTVNLASRMQTHGLGGAIHVSEAVYCRLKDRYVFRERGQVEVRGRGVLPTYLLIRSNGLGSPPAA